VPTVDFATFCYWKDAPKLHSLGVLAQMVQSHGRQFDHVIVVHQRTRGNVEYLEPFDIEVVSAFSEDHPNILSEYNIPEDDPKADEYTHGPTAAHYWKWHVINHLIAAKVSTSDYIVFSDSDCRIVKQPSSWVDEGIHILEHNPEVLLVSPSDGGKIAEKRLRGGIRLTQNNSQQLFMMNRERFCKMDLAVPWDWEVLAPYEPFQEYYYMLEGRIWRYMNREHLYRAILPEQWRYWHFG